MYESEEIQIVTESYLTLWERFNITATYQNKVFASDNCFDLFHVILWGRHGKDYELSESNINVKQTIITNHYVCW